MILQRVRQLPLRQLSQKLTMETRPAAAMVADKTAPVRSISRTAEAGRSGL
jgi:hypothetical protein